MSILYVIFIVALTVGINYYQVKVLKEKWYSPICLLTVPTCGAICVLFFITLIWNTFEKIRFEFICIIVVFFLLSLCFEIAFKWLFGLMEKKNKSKLDFLEKREGKNNILDLFSIAVPLACIIYFVILAIKFPYLSITEPDFQNIYEGQTYLYRLMCLILGAYSASKISGKSKRKIWVCFLCILPNALTFVKGTIIIAALSCMLTSIICNQKKLNTKKMLLVGLIAIVVSFIAFIGVYMVEICDGNLSKIFDIKTYKIIFNKIISYLSSGLAAFNTNIGNAQTFLAKDNIIWSVYNNLLAKIKLMTRINAISDVWTVIGSTSSAGEIKVNVHSYYGTLYLYGGWAQAILAHFINYVIIYTLYRWSKYSNMGKVCYSIHVCGFILSWFEYYYMHSFWVYLLVLYVLAMIADCLKVDYGKFKGIKKSA